MGNQGGEGGHIMHHVSGHSGLPEDVELKQMEQKAQACREKREAQLSTIYGVLDAMPRRERRAMIAPVAGWKVEKRPVPPGTYMQCDELIKVRSCPEYEKDE